ncbi:MGH1-like glycoside hydrolase domain-containing protein [Haloferacaceae archaeon DSL9]
MKADDAVLNGSTFLVTDREGVASRAHDGFYHRDTQHLDRYRFASETRALESLEVAHPRPGERTVHYGAELIRGARSLSITRRQLVTDGLAERIRLRNLSDDVLDETVTLAVGTRFDDLFQVRGHQSNRDRTIEATVETREEATAVTFSYDPADIDAEWHTTVAATAGAFSTTREAGRADAALSIPLELGPEETVDVFVAVDPAAAASEPHTAFETAQQALGARVETWDRERTAFAHEPWDDVLAESTTNLLELRLDTDHGPTLAAGVPWFATAFGRDSLIAAYQALPLSTRLAKGTCRYLAAHQATAVDEFRDAEPGKIMHEIRFGETTVRGESPHAPYFGTVDATALFVVLVHETWRWTGDDAFVEELWPHVDAALAWLDEYGDRDGDGFIEYPTDGGENGTLTHQAWKDSGDGIVRPDGTHPEGPLAVAEAQGYYYGAQVRAAELAERVRGDEALAATLRSDAETLAAAFDDAFWLPEESFYAIALDGNNDPIETVSTNPGHCLWTGLVPEARADAVIDRFVADDMFSGWGIRTISADHDAYNPQSYHLGSVWPHDNSLVVLGMARYGRTDAARTVSQALVDVARARGNDRLPELFAGFDRDETGVPVQYGEACEPQAWAAAAPFAFLRAVGAVDGPRDRLVVE